MIRLVQYGAGEKALPFIFAFFTKAVHCTHAHMVGPDNIAAFAREGQAAFIAALFTARFQYFGVYEFHNAVAAVYNHGALKYADLRRGKANAFGIVHSFRHIVKQNGQTFVKIINLPANLIQTFCIAGHDSSFSHIFSSIIVSEYYNPQKPQESILRTYLPDLSPRFPSRCAGVRRTRRILRL